MALVTMIGCTPGLITISVTDGVIAEVTKRPSSSDPGPIIHSGSDGLTFDSDTTDVAVAWYAEVTAVTNNASASSATIQGSTETFLDWFYAKGTAATKYASVNVTGVFDSNAGDYTVPALFTKSAQGSLTTTSYDGTNPSTASTTTYYWAYDSVLDDYVFGTGKDLSAESRVEPIGNALGTNYEFTMETNTYVVTGTGSSPNYLPTVTQGHHLPLLSLPLSKTWYLMMDPPAGVHEDSYDFTLRVTAQGV